MLWRRRRAPSLVAVPKTKAASRPKPSRKIRIGIAEDRCLFREALRALLQSESDFLVVGAAEAGREMAHLVRKHRPDVVVLDDAMLRNGGFGPSPDLPGSGTRFRTLLMTESLRNEEIVMALQVGARGIVLKDARPEVLFKGIRTVAAGQCWLENDVVSDLAETLRRRIAATSFRRVQNEHATYGLTARELEVVRWVLTGLANRAIARQLSITENTLKHHLTNIFDKLGVSNRLELALFAAHHKIVTTSALGSA
jgi:DNA-binding NarL/FixJ family response regulator